MNSDHTHRGFPGKYWYVAAGLVLCGSALKGQGSVGRVLALAAGIALLYGAAAGRGLTPLTPARSSARRPLAEAEGSDPIDALVSDDGPASAPLADSPNEAERLQGSGALGVGAGIGVLVVEQTPDDPAAKAGQERILPGLPDLMRGG